MTSQGFPRHFCLEKSCLPTLQKNKVDSLVGEGSILPYLSYLSSIILFSMFSFLKPFHQFPTFLHLLCPKFSQISQPRVSQPIPGWFFPIPPHSSEDFPPAHSPDSAGSSDTHRHSPGSRPGCCHWSGWTPASTAFRRSLHWRGPRANRNPWAACRWWVFLSHFRILFILFDMNKYIISLLIFIFLLYL